MECYKAIEITTECDLEKLYIYNVVLIKMWLSYYGKDCEDHSQMKIGVLE